MTPRQRAAHERMADRARVVSHADPMTSEERRAEQNRKNVAEWRRRQNEKPQPELAALMEWYRP